MDSKMIFAILITLAALWHLAGFAFGLVYVHSSLKSLLGRVPYNPQWSRVLRSADVHLWLSGLVLIGLGILDKGTGYLDNPKLWGKITVVVVWMISTQCMRRWGVPQLKQGNSAPMLHLSAVTIACWVYGAFLGCAKPLGYGVVSYPAFLMGFVVVLLASFAGLRWMRRY